MSNLHNPKILALDFDGVICDGLIEYFQTTQRTYLQIWNSEQDDLDRFASSFYRLRPVIETGWEMPILLRALVLGKTEKQILDNWANIAQEIIKLESLNSQAISRQLDGNRDRWINDDLESWLGLHRFYPGMIDRLQKIIDSDTKLYIVTTKEGRFVDRLLRQNDIVLPTSSIFGKECKRPKYETLRELITSNHETAAHLWFVEDRLQALKLVQEQADLGQIQLYLADWGYNTPQERETATGDQNINLLTLDRFVNDFSIW